MDQNKKNIEADEKTYRLRQQIIEHTYGIIKRQRGFYYITTKRGMKRASADVGLMFTALNLRRIINFVGKNVLQELLSSLGLFFPGFKATFYFYFKPQGANLSSITVFLL